MRELPELHSKEACLKLLTELASIPELVSLLLCNYLTDIRLLTVV